jgi:hypothetical protein
MFMSMTWAAPFQSFQTCQSQRQVTRDLIELPKPGDRGFSGVRVPFLASERVPSRNTPTRVNPFPKNRTLLGKLARTRR